MSRLRTLSSLIGSGSFRIFCVDPSRDFINIQFRTNRVVLSVRRRHITMDWLRPCSFMLALASQTFFRLT